MILTVEQERLVLEAYVLSCEQCGGTGQVRRTKRPARVLSNGKRVRRSQAKQVWVKCVGCKNARRLLEAVSDA